MACSLTNQVSFRYVESNQIFLKEQTMKTLLGRLVREEEAQDLIEYALLAALIALAAIVVLGPLGTAIAAKFTGIKAELEK